MNFRGGFVEKKMRAGPNLARDTSAAGSTVLMVSRSTSNNAENFGLLEQRESQRKRGSQLVPIDPYVRGSAAAV
jgi:hypothetical protein